MRQGKQTRCPKKDDNYNTPIEAFELLFQFIPRDKIVWSPFYNDGNLNMPKDIKCIHTDNDFFQYEPDTYDMIVDNPPYSRKKEIFERCEKLGAPYALLVPFDSLERQYLNETMKTRDVTVVIPRKRYKYNDNKVTMPFKSVWVCIGFGLKRQLIFE